MGDTKPVYQRIADELRGRIDSGDLRVGAQLPSRSELKRAYEASDQTVDRAVRVLKAAGYAQGQFGRGVFVADRTPLGTLLRTTGAVDSPFASQLSPPGTSLDWEATSVAVPAPRAVARRLGIEAGDRVMCTRYEYMADRKPLQFATSWEPLAITEGTDVVFPERGPYARRGVRGRMAAIGVRVVRAAELVGSRTATSAEAETLGCSPGQCLTVLERTHYDEDNRPVETSDVVVRADRWQLEYVIDYTA
ncbi:GntR family transcriptional regulator [Streptomyces polyrhachis]|uniref:GntR family transcriptional regulator n=1 Tax=Streptomyces polyrhachis TaxID=1282885 RepID=A0ABW2GP56_9ACTN